MFFIQFYDFNWWQRNLVLVSSLSVNRSKSKCILATLTKMSMLVGGNFTSCLNPVVLVALQLNLAKQQTIATRNYKHMEVNLEGLSWFTSLEPVSAVLMEIIGCVKWVSESRNSAVEIKRQRKTYATNCCLVVFKYISLFVF